MPNSYFRTSSGTRTARTDSLLRTGRREVPHLGVSLPYVRSRVGLECRDLRRRPGWRRVRAAEHPRRLPGCAVGDVLAGGRDENRHAEDRRGKALDRLGPGAATDQENPPYVDPVDGDRVEP